jgi:hypothetical protein
VRYDRTSCCLSRSYTRSFYQLYLVIIFGRSDRPSRGAIKKFIHYQCWYQEGYSFFTKTFAYSIDLWQFGHARGDYSSVIWQSYDMWVSLINPKSLAEGTGLKVSPIKFRHISAGRFCNCCRFPISKYLVFSGLISRWSSEQLLGWDLPEGTLLCQSRL